MVQICYNNETKQSKNLRDYASLKNDWYIKQTIGHTRKTNISRN